ncbi:Potentiating neddylation domain [Sesbania bispinosa]|nr:Potentiating neddylation domain [Sesbania bispinosa]
MMTLAIPMRLGHNVLDKDEYCYGVENLLRDVKDTTISTLATEVMGPVSVEDTCLCFNALMCLSVDRMDRLFESYADKSSGLIGPEGMENLCRDLHVDSADIRMVILAWLMRAEKKGFISKVEWQRGLTYLGADSITRLRREVYVVQQKVIVPECFKEIYKFAFQYNLTKCHQKTLDINSACQLLNVVLKPSFFAEVNLLIEFLKDQKEYGAVTEDQ